MTEFSRTPVFTAKVFEEKGYRIVIRLASTMRVAAQTQRELCATIRRDGGTHDMHTLMETRIELYDVIGCSDYEKFDAFIAVSTAREVG